MINLIGSIAVVNVPLVGHQLYSYLWYCILVLFHTAICQKSGIHQKSNFPGTLYYLYKKFKFCCSRMLTYCCKTSICFFKWHSGTCGRDQMPSLYCILMCKPVACYHPITKYQLRRGFICLYHLILLMKKITLQMYMNFFYRKAFVSKELYSIVIQMNKISYHFWWTSKEQDILTTVQCNISIRKHYPYWCIWSVLLYSRASVSSDYNVLIMITMIPYHFWCTFKEQDILSIV